MDKEMLPIVVSLGIFLVTTALQGIGFAFFLGKMREQQNNHSTLMTAWETNQKAVMEALLARMAKGEDKDSESATDRAKLNLRVDNVEREVRAMARVRDDVIRLDTKFGEHARNTSEGMAQQKNILEGLQRGLANMMQRRPGGGGPALEISDMTGG